MFDRKFLHILFSLLVIASIVLGGSVQVKPVMAMPMDPTDESKVPHYFGPYPNWANSPFTLPDAQVVITGSGTGATAEATVGANGAITGITVTNRRAWLFECEGRHLGSGTGAMAKATIVKKGSVVEVIVNTPGTGYTAPTVTFSGGGPGGGAAAIAYGGVEQVFARSTAAAATPCRRWTSTCPMAPMASRPRVTLRWTPAARSRPS
jgi:hypothetical protein